MSTCRCKYQVFMIRHTHTHTPTHKQTHLPFVEQTLQKPIYCFIKVNISYRHIQIHDTHTLMYISHSLCEWCIWLLEILTFPAHPEGQIPTFQSLFGCPGTAEQTGIWTPTGEQKKRRNKIDYTPTTPLTTPTLVESTTTPLRTISPSAHRLVTWARMWMNSNLRDEYMPLPSWYPWKRGRVTREKKQEKQNQKIREVRG